MKTLLLALLIGAAMLTSGFAQERTDERKWTIDPETGDTIYTEAVIITESEDITPRSSMIVINPLKFLLFYNISYFYKLNDATAIGGGIQMPTISGLNGFGVNAEVRFYPRGNNLRGFYFAPNVSYNNLSGEDSDESVSITSFGGLIGWQWFPGEQFAIGLGIGVDYYFFSGDDDDFSKVNGTAPLLRFDIGYAW
ncbi:MAG: hypothetical protein A2W11_00770 [Ignavibacteria bacterium RBG_16_35_7]|nr:MAG: hypothetical protein A2W11_00770 [Ignavibacteria bacterium RBG_16_35_7]